MSARPFGEGTDAAVLVTVGGGGGTVTVWKVDVDEVAEEEHELRLWRGKKVGELGYAADSEGM